METADGMQMEAGSESAVYVAYCECIMHDRTE